MAKFVWDVYWHTTSPGPCINCKELALVSPFVMITSRAEKPSADHLEPHSECQCQRRVEYRGQAPEDSLLGDKWAVRSLTAGEGTTDELEDGLNATHVNPSDASTPLDVDIEHVSETSRTFELETGYKVEEEGASLGFTVGEEWKGSVTSTMSTSISLEPGTKVSEYLAVIQTVVPVYGVLYNTETEEELDGSHFVGWAETTEEVPYFGSVSSL